MGVTQGKYRRKAMRESTRLKKGHKCKGNFFLAQLNNPGSLTENKEITLARNETLKEILIRDNAKPRSATCCPGA
jgi:hypothetical protein